MPKKLLATTIIIALAITMLASVSMSRANFVPPTRAEIQIGSSIFSNTTSYDKSTQTVFVFINVPLNETRQYQEVNHIYYRLDGHSAVEFTHIIKSEKPWFTTTCMHYSANATLDNLETGSHTISVFAQGTKEELSAKRSFTIADSITSNSSTQSASPTLADSTLKSGNTYSVDFSFLALGVVGVLVIISLGLVVYIRKRRKDKP